MLGVAEVSPVCIMDPYLKEGEGRYSLKYRGSSPNAHFGTRKKSVLGEIALLEDFGTTLCKDIEKSRWSEESH